VVIVGHTASGKTGFSIELAKKINEWRGQGTAEIVNADSRQLYKGFDIGTAKITHEEMEGIPHHLINVLNPKEPVTISWFQKEVEKVVEDIHQKGHVPMLVGGSMLYVSSVIDGLEPLPASSKEKREALLKEYKKDDGVTLHKKLSELDPEAALAIPKENPAHLIRAIEVIQTTGKKLRESKTKKSVLFDLFIIGCSLQLEERKKTIEERTKELFRRGWMDEVKHILASGVSVDDPAMISSGYKEIAEFIKTDGKDEGFLIKLITQKTMQYAKRQMTWWKRDERIRWLKK
jgi:tRNA dimethylallyltransferase